MEVGNNNQDLNDSKAAICPGTAIRKEACACGICGLHASSDGKYTANRRDARALLYLIADCLSFHPSYNIDRATWADVSHVANFRRRLMDMAVGMGALPEGSEQTARRRIEEALGTTDEDLDEALLEAL